MTPRYLILFCQLMGVSFSVMGLCGVRCFREMQISCVLGVLIFIFHLLIQSVISSKCVVSRC